MAGARAIEQAEAQHHPAPARQTHLAHIFAKLDVSSRAQLAAQAARQPGG